jgi:hypothetical protein
MGTESSTRASRDELIAKAQERAEGSVLPDDWGTILELDEGGGTFVGRYVAETIDERWDPPRKVYLFVDEQGSRCYMPGRFRLEQEMSRVEPGATVAIYRGPDAETKAGNTVHTYGVVSTGSDADDLPF